VLLRHPANRWYRSLRVPVAHPVAEIAYSRGMKDTDAHGALIYQHIFELFSLKNRVRYLSALADGSAAVGMALALVLLARKYKAAQAGTRL
jgi:hypothetical protein